MRKRLRQMDKLIRLADLREDLARRALAQAGHALSERTRERDEAQGRSLALRRDQAERREILRNPLIGSAQLRGQLSAVLTTFEADRTREAEARKIASDAEAARRTAEQTLIAARFDLIQAGRLTEKRRRIREPIQTALFRAAEARDELEAEEIRRDLPAPQGGMT
ncbi:hypothetical protein [Paracoccus laeviglucosivorans]|uniref:Uncharacterized protein n=1 Tax=Paracoccus laeviglucosivorans TaxID=1197861 RepID=A0A521BE68_9RHOB|nr:hypothetical protein [Paracoccus laeviglucosivorans]SMO45382.1 hypothetical protein SAMN06265221_102256 [Paracoccus laeviglucosivorans]